MHFDNLKMNMNKLLSIIVPSYNMEAYLPKCLRSLIIDDNELLQTLDVIVVNDGSKDRTSEIAHEFAAKFPGVFRVIDKPNGHYGSCINAALPNVVGTFVKILDADDSFEPEGLKRLLIVIDSFSYDPKCEVDVIFTNKVRVNEDGVETAERCLALPHEIPLPLEDLTDDFIASIWMHHVAYRASVFTKINYKQLEGINFTDSQWVYNPMACVRKVYCLPVVVYRYLLGREGQSVSVYWKNLSHTRRVTEQLMDDYDVLVAKSTIGGRAYLKARLYARIMVVYRYSLISNYRDLLPEEPQLIEFDNKCQRMQPDLYKRVEKVRYFQRVPIGYVKAWRKKVAGNPLQWWILKLLLQPIFKIWSSRYLRFCRRLLNKCEI